MAIIINILQKDIEENDQLILGICVIGRSVKCDFFVNDNLVSSRHGSFQLNNSGHVIYKDQGSSNGSFLNCNSINQSRILVNDILQIGSLFIKIDESRLTPEERKSIGFNKIVQGVNNVFEYEVLTKIYPKTSKNITLETKTTIMANARKKCL